LLRSETWKMKAGPMGSVSLAEREEVCGTVDLRS
jgi:hypothetical protein